MNSNRWKIEDITEIYNTLADEESCEVFNEKFRLIINKDEDDFLDWFLKRNKHIYCPELDQYEEKQGKREYILFGAGKQGKKAKKILDATNRNVVAWCDNNRQLWGGDIERIKVISPAEIVNYYMDTTVIITTLKDCFYEIYSQLLMMGFPRMNILLPENGFLIAFAGQQYFDLFDSNAEEVFVDAGCWNGVTSEAFVKWCHGNYSHIYAFEPDENCWRKCEGTFLKEKIDNIDLIKKGTWKETTNLYFRGNGRGSSNVSTNNISSIQVPVVSIDDILKGKKVTFIKMDVEGSEFEALMGAKESIKKYKPRLAICVYHKNDDMWKLAKYILSLNPSYKLYLRHYSSCSYETVLYAI